MVTITAIAEQKIKELMVEEKDIVGLRVYVKGGGCHGYHIRDGLRVEDGRRRHRD